MAEEDIYFSKRKFERFKNNLEKFSEKPLNNKKRKYYSKNKDNLEYFRKLFVHFDTRDLSYVRRNRLCGSMKLICYLTEKNLRDLDRNDINQIVGYMNNHYTSPKAKECFILDLKHFWKILFPEKDSQGRVDDTSMPYVVRHLSAKQDKSKQKRRGDKLTFVEFEKIVAYFSEDPRMQFYLTLAFESLGRPQEILYLKIKDIEKYDSYAKLWISEHGKEGTGFLQVLDSYPYMVRWLEVHPFKDDPNSFIFINLRGNVGEQMRPVNINKKIRVACNNLKINKPVTAYSLKRNGVTYRRLNGYSDVEIQHVARWTSTKQLKTYDLSQSDDTFKRELAKRGLIQSDEYKDSQPETKKCLFCDQINGFTDEFCSNCKRPLDREEIRRNEEKRDQQIQKLHDFMEENSIAELFKTVRMLQQEIQEMKK